MIDKNTYRVLFTQFKVCVFLFVSSVLSAFYSDDRDLNKIKIERSIAANTLLRKVLALTYIPSTNDMKPKGYCNENASGLCWKAVVLNEKSPFKNKPAFLFLMKYSSGLRLGN